MGQEENEKTLVRVMFLAEFSDHEILGYGSELELACQKGRCFLLD